MGSVTLLDQRCGQSHLIVTTSAGPRHLILSRYGFLQSLVTMPAPTEDEIAAVQSWVTKAHETARKRWPEIALYHEPITVTATP